MKIVLAHHWLLNVRGGEKVLEQLCQLFPFAPIETFVARPEFPSQIISRHPLRQSLLAQMPGALRFHGHYLPLFPLFLRARRVDADLLLSSDASLIKGIGKTRRTRHVCYCYSPPRYLWDQQAAYLVAMSRLSGMILKTCTGYLQAFDRRAAQLVDSFIAISNFVAQRITTAYGRTASVVYPPVDATFYVPGQCRENFYLVVSALTPYKRIDLAVQAFAELKLPLVVIGDGPERGRLAAMATGRITFLGAQPDAVLRDHYQRCKALIFPGVEDFGITPLEAQACGRPVVALARGGALESVVDGQTGLFFQDQSRDALVQAVLELERNPDQFDPDACRKNAWRFRPEIFRRKMQAELMLALPEIFQGYTWPE